MKSFIQTLSDTEKKITVSLPKADFDSYKCKKEQPQNFGEGLFPHDMPAAAKNKISEIAEDIFLQQNVQPLELTAFAQEKDNSEEFAFSLCFTVLPVVHIDLEKISVSVPPPILPQEVYDHLVLSLQKKHKTAKEKKNGGTAEYGDYALISVKGFINDRSAPCLTVSHKDFEISKDNYFKKSFGFNLSELLVTMKAGEEKEFSFVFQKDYPEKFLQNKSVRLSVKLHAVKQAELAPFDDALARKEGFENKEQLEDALKNSALKNHFKKIRELGKQKLMEELLRQCDFQLLDFVLQRCVEEYKKQIYAILNSYGAASEEIEQTLVSVKDTVLENAQKQAKAEILLLSLAQQYQLAVSEQEFQSYLEQEADKNNVSSERMKEFLIKNNLLANSYDRLLIEKTLNYLYDRVKKEW